MITKIYNTEVTQFESSNYWSMLFWKEKIYCISVFIKESFLFTDTSKNNCFAKVLEVIKYLFFLDFRVRVYQTRGTFRRVYHTRYKISKQYELKFYLALKHWVCLDNLSCSPQTEIWENRNKIRDLLRVIFTALLSRLKRKITNYLPMTTILTTSMEELSKIWGKNYHD